MPLDPVNVVIKRPGGTLTATLGINKTEAEIAGSPFPARVYRVAQIAVARDEASPGTADADQVRRISILDPNAAVRTNDIVLIPSDDDPATTERAKILRPRRYGDRVQCDLETGVE